MSTDPSLLWTAKPPAPRQPKPGELLFEFHVERTHSFWRVELRDAGEWGVEAQFFENAEFSRADRLGMVLHGKAGG